MVFFCPGCWAETQESDVVCPACGFNLSDYARLPYEEKLILALRHPLQDNQLMAIRLLGDLRSPRAVDYFREMLTADTDFYLAREIVRSLRRIGTAEAAAIIAGLRAHPSRLVQNMVVEEHDAREGSALAEQGFQETVRRLAEELLPGGRVEFLPAREMPHIDPVYPVRFKTETADLVVSFPQGMVLMRDGEEPIRETVLCLVRLVYYFRK